MIGERIPRETFTHPPSAHVWAAVSMKGKVNLTFYTITLDRWRYSDLLEESLYDQADEMFGEGNWTLVQDRAPCHKAAYTIERIEERGEVIRDWPGASPDLNPIENIWRLLKRRVYQRNPRNQAELESIILEKWEDLSEETIIDIARSMPRRVDMLIETEGQHTGY